MHQLLDRIKFIVETQIQRGAFVQLLIIGLLIVGIAVSGGLIAWVLTDVFDYPGQAIWWAFLRLTDPGYLGDDEGLLLRIISTTVTVLGYVLFMGSLIAIMTQWLNRTIRTLESGLTPISMSGHILILGWTNRTPSIVRELVLSEGRVQRFLRKRGTSKLKIVILTETVSAELKQELRDKMGTKSTSSQIILRSGSSMRLEHLLRVDFMRSAAMILPGADFELGGPESIDSRVIKTLMTTAKHMKETAPVNTPVIVAEIFDAQKVPIAEAAFKGQLRVISGDAFISRLLTQNIRHRGLSQIYAELLSHTSGNEVYVREWDELAGNRFADITHLFNKAIPLGIVRPHGDTFKPILNPPPNFEILAGDRIVMIARSYEDAEPSALKAIDANEQRLNKLPIPTTKPLRRVLLLGWSHKAVTLIQEFGSYENERFDVDIISIVPIEERLEALDRIHFSENHVNVRHFEGDYTYENDLLEVNPADFDNIVFLGADWMDSNEESDARTILGYVLLRSVLKRMGKMPEVLIELKDPSNEELFQERPGEVIISPVILSHVLAHAALRQELTSVFNELFGPGGAEIFFRPAADYELTGNAFSFTEIQRRGTRAGEIAIGLRIQETGDQTHPTIYLNPPQQKRWQIKQGDEVIVLTRY